MKEYVYYWYHHMMPDDERKEIERVLAEKDYEAFVELYKKYTVLSMKYGSYNEELETWFPMTFLPSHICVYGTEAEEFEEDEYVLSKPAFMKITYAECECG